MSKYIAYSLLLFLIIPMSCGNIHSVTKEDTPANREESAKKYLKVVPPGDLIKDMTANLALTMSEEDRTIFLDMMIKNLDVNKIEDILMWAMVKNFTVKEIDALANFYGSPEGKSATKKVGAYMADAMPEIQKEVLKAVIRSIPRREFEFEY